MRRKANKLKDMLKPVQCNYCGAVYDIGKVTVTMRYADCSVWQSPCCNRTVDDRGETGWKSTSDYIVVSLDPNSSTESDLMYYYINGVRCRLPITGE